MATATIPTSPASPASREAVVMRSDAPTVSVCVPVYNAAVHLGECIDSILAQTYTDFELLIVDDGSTDDSRDVVRAYTDPRIRLLENTHDYIGSLNLLLREARGRYVARMDADDLMLPDRLQVQVDYMEAHPEVDILGGGMTYFGSEHGTALPQPGERPLTFSLFMRGCALMHPTVMMRRASIEAHGLRYEREFIYAEDYRLWVMALEAGLRLVNLDRPLIKYKVSPAQVSAVHKVAQDEAGRRVKEEIVRWQTRGEARWALQSPLRLPDTPNLLTVIIPFLNEGEEVVATVRGVRDTVGDRVDILVINDASYDGFPYGEQLASYGVHYVLNRMRRGVAASRDLGVRLCRTPYFLLLDAHMRFYDSTWADRVVEALQANDRQLLCCQTRFLYHHPETGELGVLEYSPTTYGAYCPFGRKEVWPDIEWNLREMRPGEPCEDIAAVLGAGYAASRRYWARLRGLAGLRSYGSDEAYLSFKVWLEGGRCVLLKDVVIGHVYRSVAPYVILGQESVYNQLLIARLLFPQSLYCRTLVRALRQKGATAVQALHDLAARRRSLGRLRAYYRSIFTRPMADVLSLHAERCGIDTTASAAVCELLDHLPDIYDRLKRCAPVGDGLYEGRAGRALWLCRYARHLADYGNLLSVKFEHVWQDGGTREAVQPYLVQVRDAFKADGYRVGTDDIHYRHVCYADTPQHLVINYNGDIFKCTARDFVSAQREGVLHDDGSVKLNDVYERRMRLRYVNPACLACKILPICNGGCSQSKMEAAKQTECYRGMSETDKDAYIKARVEEIMKQTQQV